MGKFSPSVLLALKEALSAIYWTKRDLRFFIEKSLKHSSIVSQIDWENQTKFESCSQLIDRMSEKESFYYEDLLQLISNILQIDDFEHLRQWDQGDVLVKKAQNAVSRLQKLSNGYINNFKEQILAEQNREKARVRIEKSKDYQAKLDGLRGRFFEIIKQLPQERGYSLEVFLTDLFAFFDLAPRGSFKIQGEQIDGAFTHDGTDYLMEAKWRNALTANADLYVFAGKIAGKLKNTLGVFISINGFSKEAIDANSHMNKSMILMDGQDLMMVLEDRITLPEMIRLKRRHAAETGEILYHLEY